MYALARYALIGGASLLSASHASPTGSSSTTNAGNVAIESPMGHQFGKQNCPPQFDVAELYDEIASVYGDDLATEIASELGPNGSIGFGELFCPTDVAGVSDIDTILVNTKSTDGEQEMSEFAAAMVVVHEYEHVQHRRGSGGGQEDPLTNDPLCGPCNHALMHYEQANIIATVVCAHPGADWVEPCEVIELNLNAGLRAASCNADGCNPDWCPTGYAAQLASRIAASSAFDDCCGR